VPSRRPTTRKLDDWLSRNEHDSGILVPAVDTLASGSSWIRERSSTLYMHMEGLCVPKTRYFCSLAVEIVVAKDTSCTKGVVYTIPSDVGLTRSFVKDHLCSELELQR
jgi:hypothetical protein